MKTYDAVLERDIEYFKGKELVKVPKDTVTIVDVDTGIALLNGDYVKLCKSEYTIAC